MEGRWQVRIENGFGNFTRGPQTVGWVHAVPCGEADINRAVERLHEVAAMMPADDVSVESWHDHLVREVVSALAAGETP